MGFTWALLSVLRQSAATIVSILILEALAVLLPVAVEYARKRSYYSRLLRSLDALDRKVLLCEVLDEPDFLEGPKISAGLKTIWSRPSFTRGATA